MVVNAIVADVDMNWCMTLVNELNVTKEFKVIEMINDGIKIISELERLKPELIILDLDLPSINGLKIIEDIERNNTIKTKVIVITDQTKDMSKVISCKCVKRYLLKNMHFKEIILNILKVAQEISEKCSEQQILEYLFDMGFSTKNQGTSLLKECIKIFLSQTQFDCKVKDLIEEVANKFLIDGYKVKNNIYTSIKVAWNLGDKEHITDKLKLGADEEPSPKKVISMSRYYIDK